MLDLLVNGLLARCSPWLSQKSRSRNLWEVGTHSDPQQVIWCFNQCYLLHLFQWENENVIPGRHIQMRMIHLQLDDLGEEVNLESCLMLLRVINYQLPLPFSLLVLFRFRVVLLNGGVLYHRLGILLLRWILRHKFIAIYLLLPIISWNLLLLLQCLGIASRILLPRHHLLICRDDSTADLVQGVMMVSVAELLALGYASSAVDISTLVILLVLFYNFLWRIEHVAWRVLLLLFLIDS